MELRSCTAWLAEAKDNSNQVARVAVLAGLVKGYRGAESGRAAIHSLLGDPAGSALSNPLVRIAARFASQGDAEVVFRMLGIDVLAWHGRQLVESAGQVSADRPAAGKTDAAGEIGALLTDLLLPGQPSLVQSAAARALATLDHRSSSRAVFTRWTQLGTVARREILAQSLRSPAATDALMDGLQEQTVLPAELPPGIRTGLAESRDPQRKARAIQLLAKSPVADRRSVVAKYQDVTKIAGDVRRGAALVKEHCLACHAIQGMGTPIGPDLSSVGARRNDVLLVDILDPSRNVTPDFVTYVVTTKRGQVFTGAMTTETTDTITLRRAGSELDTIRREEIEELRSTGKSLMPDGVEEKLNVQQLADVLEFLRRPARDLLGGNRN